MQNRLEDFISANREAFDGEEPGASVWENLEKKFVKKQRGLEQFVQTNKDAFDSEVPSAQVWENLEKKFVKKEGALEQFVKANRDAFDTEAPGEEVWNKIERTFVKQDEKKPTVIYRSTMVRVLSIAAAVILVAVSVWFFTTNNNVTKIGVQPVAQIKKVNSDTATTVTNNATAPATQPSAQDKIAETNPQPKDNSAGKDADVSAEDDQTQEIFYYTKLTEVKFRELKKIEKDDPALYHSFAGEIHKLDSAYHGLQAMLKENADKEAILSAMITNLKMQTEILSKQLYIIHSLKKSKKTGNENKDQSI